MPDLLADLEWRGLVAQATDRAALAAALAAGPVTLYAGFDPSAESMQVGNLVPLLLLRRFQLAGHRPIAVVGGATGLVGDPSGRAGERELSDAAVVGGRVAAFRSQMGRFLDLTGPAGALIVDNLEWTRDVPVLTFLRDVGKHFTVNTMLAKESVGGRLAATEGLSFAEFSYMLLQAMDYRELYDRYGCTLQVGGSEQWGNITAGLELLRRTGRAPGGAHALTHPLVTDSRGQKLGKSAGNAVWLDPARTSPYAFYQFWLATPDDDVVASLRLFTFLARERIEELAGALAARPAAREAQRALAEEVTRLVHGPAELAQVAAASRALFGGGELGELDPALLAAALEEAPHLRLPAGSPLPAVVDLLVGTGLVAGRNEARRTITQGGAYLNNRRVADPEEVPAESELLHGRFLVVRRGSRSVGMVDRPAR